MPLGNGLDIGEQEYVARQFLVKSGVSHATAFLATPVLCGPGRWFLTKRVTLAYDALEFPIDLPVFAKVQLHHTILDSGSSLLIFKSDDTVFERRFLFVDLSLVTVPTISGQPTMESDSAITVFSQSDDFRLCEMSTNHRSLHPKGI